MGTRGKGSSLDLSTCCSCSWQTWLSLLKCLHCRWLKCNPVGEQYRAGIKIIMSTKIHLWDRHLIWWRWSAAVLFHFDQWLRPGQEASSRLGHLKNGRRMKFNADMGSCPALNLNSRKTKLSYCRYIITIIKSSIPTQAKLKNQLPNEYEANRTTLTFWVPALLDWDFVSLWET